MQRILTVAWIVFSGVLGGCAAGARQNSLGAASDDAGAPGASAGGGGGSDSASGGLGAASSATGGARSSATGGARSSATGGARSSASGGSNAGRGGSGTGPSTGGMAACDSVREISIDDSATGTGADEFDFAGAWSTSSAPEKYQGDDHYASATGASATLHFEGQSVALHAATASHHGIALVSLDGAAPSDVDMYATGRADDVELWKSGALGAGMHVLELSVSGRKNAASSGTTISIDRVVVQRKDCSGGSGGTGAGGSAGSTAGSSGSSAGGSSAGGTNASGGMNGQSGHSGGTMARPNYNTGPGFFVVGGKLYDANGAEFRIRGVNKLHWDADSSGIPKTHANTERWDIDFSQATSKNLGLMQQSIDNQIVPMPGNWQGTCDESAATLTSIVDTWVAQAAAWKTLDKYIILNVANEWGPSGTGWRDAYVTAVSRLRAAGYLCTISITSGGCGQDNADLVNYAQAVFDSDPQKNVIFDQHIYGNWPGQSELTSGLDKLAATGLPMIVGEFGPGRGIGPSPTDLTPAAIMQACETRGIGWLAWAWDDPASNADDTWFALSKNGNYDSSADLTMFGKTVVEDPSYGLLALAQPATIF